MRFVILLISLISSSVSAGVIWKYPWQQKRISTCFTKAETKIRDIGVLRTHIHNWTPDEKETLQRLLAQEYSLKRTGIEFTGFENCDDDPKADIVLFKARNGGLLGGQASVGPKRKGFLEGYPLARGYVLLYDLNLTNITHEFGHVLGLQHEHLHPEAFDEDPGCLRRILNKPAKVSEHYIYTPYNRNSVMNYCHTSAPGGDQIGLDQEDIRNLRSIYP